MKNILTNTLNILKKTLIISLYFCFPYLKTTNTTKTIQKKKKDGYVVVVKQLIPKTNKSEIRLGEVEGHDYITVQLCSYVDFN